jgi:ssRNA-specific RNase YbeY (16S rRNA maturation enzyme)
MGPPLASAAMINAVTFATYAQANNVRTLSHCNYHLIVTVTHALLHILAYDVHTGDAVIGALFSVNIAVYTP